jgi:RNA polymerase sigma-70 factor (ECF subfamily)
MEAMMCPSGAEIASIMERAKTGDEAAIRDFLACFESEVRTVVRGRLPRRLRTQFDSMDFVQAVWQSFFSGLRKQPRQFENVRHLRTFLAGVARNKVYAEHRRLTRVMKRDLAREERLYVEQGDREVERSLVSMEPTASQTVQASERLAQLIAGCSPTEMQVITLRYQGLTFEEIAARTKISDRSVRRIIEEARSRMEQRG